MRLAPLLAAAAAAAIGFLATAARADDYDLAILTPHNEYIQFEFANAFSRHVGKPVRIRWVLKPTGAVLQQLEAQDRAKKGESFDFDVFFGGGVPDHELAAGKGFLEAPKLPAEVLAGVPKEIAGVANIDDQNLWYGSALSAFGILMNKRGLANQKLPPIKTWADLADPKMKSWVVLADPRRSASVRVSYELILQQYGWEKGWPMIMAAAANSRLIADSSAAVPNEIAKGDVLAGPCIDFYGYAQMAKAGPDVLEYINPAGGSAITPDPISMLRKPPHREMAERFIAFVLSAEGQKLWALPPGAPGGPEKHELRRMPVRPDVCKELGEKMIVPDPFKAIEEGTFRKMDDKLQASRSALLAELIGAACVDAHMELKQAWEALNKAGRPAAAVAEFEKLPFAAEQMAEMAKRIEAGGREARTLVREWSEFFRKKYDKVVALSGS